jgi:hypothetical protein
MTGIKNDETSACAPLLMHETEDEAIFFVFAARICNKDRFTYGRARRKLVDHLLAGHEVITCHGFKCADLRSFSRAGIAQPT